jgi:hypothetical protein
VKHFVITNTSNISLSEILSSTKSVERGIIIKSLSSGQIAPFCARTLQEVERLRNLWGFSKSEEISKGVPLHTER